MSMSMSMDHHHHRKHSVLWHDDAYDGILLVPLWTFVSASSSSVTIPFHQHHRTLQENHNQEGKKRKRRKKKRREEKRREKKDKVVGRSFTGLPQPDGREARRGEERRGEERGCLLWLAQRRGRWRWHSSSHEAHDEATRDASGCVPWWWRAQAADKDKDKDKDKEEDEDKDKDKEGTRTSTSTSTSTSTATLFRIQHHE